LGEANDRTIQAIAKGHAYDGTTWRQTELHNVHHVPELGRRNPFSVGSTTDKDNKIRKTKRTIEFFCREFW
jgi:hypothetical protein